MAKNDRAKRHRVPAVDRGLQYGGRRGARSIVAVVIMLRSNELQPAVGAARRAASGWSHNPPA